MCIVFVWKRKHDEATGKYKFILAANRDEFLHRETAVADFWHDHPDVLGGRAINAGVEGGTWLCISKQGKIAFLTNLTNVQTPANQHKRGRGLLSSNFLTEEQKQQTAKAYMSRLAKEKSHYRPFNLIVGNVFNDLYYMNNVDNEPPTKMETEYICLSNGTLSNGWLKVKNSMEKFRKIVDEVQAGTTALSKEDVQGKLLTLLIDKEKNYPDAAVEHMEDSERLSAIFVTPDSYECGTRTNTVILIDQENHVTFLERTKRDVNNDILKWLTTIHEFKMPGTNVCNDWK